MDELYIVARSVLLDALDALGAHRDALTLVGAQAVYLRVGEADIAVAAYTTDGDLALDPQRLAEIPPLERALGEAGFNPSKAGSSVGIWITTRATQADPKTQVAVDLLVPATVAPGGGRRAARLSGHDARAARIVAGLEGALVDAEIMTITSLEPDVDKRAHDLRVAGPAALLAAKVHKIQDRLGQDRLSDKDALDVLRLLRGTSTDELSARMAKMQADPRSEGTARQALLLLREQFGSRGAIGAQMAVRSTAGLADPAEIAGACELLAQDLLDRVR
jgi:hypothetical protein